MVNINICSICLCTGIEVQPLEEALSNFYDELCDFESDVCDLCCTICTYLLRKFYNFRNKCQKANNVLNKWKKRSIIFAGIPLKELHKKLSPSSLGLSNDTNRAVFFCNQMSDDKTKSNNFDNLLSCNDKDAKFIKPDINSEKKVTDEFETAQNIVLDGNYILFDSQIASEELSKLIDTIPSFAVHNQLKTEPQFDDNEIKYDDNDTKYDDIVLTNDGGNHDQINTPVVTNKRKKYSGSSEDEEKQTLCKRKKITTENEQQQIIWKRKKITAKNIPKQTIFLQKEISKQNMEEATRNMKKRLEIGDVRDRDGNVIEADVILNNLDKIHRKTLAKISRNCVGNGPLTPQVIDQLGQIRIRFGDIYSSMFITKYLATDEEIMEELKKRAFDQIYLQSEHKCTRCVKYFKSAKLRDYHIAQFHDETKPHKCKYCDMRFHRVQTVKNHMQSHQLVFQCRLCPLVTGYPTAMKSHFNRHKGLQYPCNKCNAVFNCPSGLGRHMNAAHHAAAYICPHCARKFHNKLGLYLHKKKKHLNATDTIGPPSAKCEQCNIHFVTDVVYRDHLKKSHGAERVRAPPKHLKKIKRDGTGKRAPVYTCRVCKHVESSLGYLMVHFKSEHPHEHFDTRRIALHDTYQFLCHVCGQEFRDRTAFTDHKNVHTGARPYVCTECPKAFHIRCHLSIHMKRHRPPTYQCPICDKKFHCGANLAVHKRIHTGNRRYVCTYCGKTFLHQASVNEHVRGVHLHIRRERKHNKPTSGEQ